MGGSANFPGSLDDNTSLYDVTDGVTSVNAAHHNNLKEAIKAIEAKLGIKGTVIATSIDYRLGNPTGGHNHDGATGNGSRIQKDHWITVLFNGTMATGVNLITGPIVPRDAQVLSVLAGLRIGPSGGTTVLDVHAGPTSLWEATQANRPHLGPTDGISVVFAAGLPNLGTVPSGIMLQIDVDGAGTNSGGDGLSISFLFRE